MNLVNEKIKCHRSRERSDTPCIHRRGPLGLSRLEAQSHQESSDRTTLRAIFGHIQQLKADIERAETSNNWTEAQFLGNELDRLQDHLHQDKALGARIKALGSSSPKRKARESVRIALTSARAQIGTSMPHLETHLRTHIRTTGYGFAYRPPHPLAWDL